MMTAPGRHFTRDCDGGTCVVLRIRDIRLFAAILGIEFGNAASRGHVDDLLYSGKNF